MPAIEPTPAKRPRTTSATGDMNCADGQQLETMRSTYAKDGCVFPVRGLFTQAELKSADDLLTRLTANRPKSIAAEDLLNLHMTVPEIFDLCRHPSVVAVARDLLGTDNISVFTSRILCKLPKTGKEIPWHQDSNYWPLVPPGETDVKPCVASVWIAFDDVTDANGPMEVLPFSACPESQGRNVEEMLIKTNNKDDRGFDNFNITLDASALHTEGAQRVLIRKGEAEWHSAWTIHRSEANLSDQRRLAWIVRYVPTGTRVQPGIRGSFDENYRIIPIAGKGVTAPPAGVTDSDIYAPCVGNSPSQLAALKV